MGSALMWAILVLGAMGTGASFVGILVAKREAEAVFGVTALAAFVGCAWAFGEITVTYDRFDAIVYAFVFGLAGIGGGYALVSTLLGWIARREHPAQVALSDTGARAAPAVFVLGEVEPTDYSPSATAAAFEELSEEGLLKASIGVLPFLFMAQKTRYRAAGGTSPSARQLDDVASRLGRTLESKAELIASAWCEGERSLATRIAEAVADGFRTIIVAETVIAESLEVDAAKRAVVAMDLDEHGVDVVYTDPLWRSERVAGLVTARALAVAGDLSTAGIVLVGQGQPDERSRAFREYDEHETAFLNHVRMLLLDRGVPEQSVRIAWADWRTPEVTGSVRHLAALGCRRIVVSPSCFPLDSIATLLDLRLSVRQARVDDTVSVVTLPAWHDDPALIEALRSGVVSALAQAETQA